MRIKVEEITDNENIMGHVVLHCLGRQIKANDDIVSKIREDGFAEVDLIINGEKIDGLKTFVDHWQSEVEKMTKEEAKKLFEEKFSNKFNDISELLSDLQDRVDEKIEKIKPDWEKEL